MSLPIQKGKVFKAVMKMLFLNALLSRSLPHQKLCTFLVVKPVKEEFLHYWERRLTRVSFFAAYVIS